MGGSDYVLYRETWSYNMSQARKCSKEGGKKPNDEGLQLWLKEKGEKLKRIKKEIGVAKIQAEKKKFFESMWGKKKKIVWYSMSPL